jgi:hypothetical protein
VRKPDVPIARGARVDVAVVENGREVLGALADRLALPPRRVHLRYEVDNVGRRDPIDGPLAEDR